MMAVLTHGPLDGLVYPLKAGQKVVEMVRPRMTAQQMIALDITPQPEPVPVPLTTYIYVEQPGKLTKQGFSVFLFSGERRPLG